MAGQFTGNEAEEAKASADRPRIGRAIKSNLIVVGNEGIGNGKRKGVDLVE